MESTDGKQNGVASVRAPRARVVLVSSGSLFTSIDREVECEDALVIGGPLEDRGGRPLHGIVSALQHEGDGPTSLACSFRWCTSI
jgi:hypothetical protein